MFEPYAAKAIIQHEWYSGTLSIWLTFHFPMNQKHKPADTVWLVKLDGTLTAITLSAWQDAFTMLLTISGVVVRPGRVLVKFNGPDSLLETTWLKNWEPWGYILSTDYMSYVMPVGSIIIWSGSVATIPLGWHLCNGLAGTPDLRNRFIYGADTAPPPGVIGGVGSHSHTATITPHHHEVDPSSPGTVQAGTQSLQNATPSEVVTINSTSMLPPFYALAFIMKL
jgi:hypothetical protein